MEQLKTYIQQLPLLEQISLVAWLTQLIEKEVQENVSNADSADKGEMPEWMWLEAEKQLIEFKTSGGKGLSWDEVKALGNKRKSA